MSNTDLQQYNATPSFPSTANVNTNADPYLLPTDGPLVTADSNAVLQAPVNSSLKAMRDWVVGLRGAIIGDFAGAVQKTVRSWYANLTGGTTHTKAAGTITASGPAAPGVAIEAETGDIQATAGDILALTGKIRALVDYIQSVTNGFISGDLSIPAYAGLDRGILRFIGTVSSGSNPARGTSLKNQLRAKNIPKGYMYVTFAGGAITRQEGAGAWTASIVNTGGADPYRIRFTLADAMDDAYYAPVFNVEGGGSTWAGIEADTKTTTQFDVSLWLAPGMQLDVTTALGPVSIVGHLHGQQTT
jgi:hypothetical protein